VDKIKTKNRGQSGGIITFRKYQRIKQATMTTNFKSSGTQENRPMNLQCRRGNQDGN
jgi:hypothetical protein